LLTQVNSDQKRTDVFEDCVIKGRYSEVWRYGMKVDI